MYLKKETFMVMGLSRSGVAAATFLLEKNAAVYIYDDVSGENIEKNIRSLTSRGAVAVTADTLEQTIASCTCLVLSPGIPIDHPVPVQFRKENKRILSESELGALYVRALPVAVTGTNGKTTTVTMINEVLKADGKNSVACGNIGVPFLNCRDLSEDDFAVVEVSSFQLETLASFRPHIAVVLNISQDHLNRHYNMENYIFLKSKLLKNSTESEYAVLNADDPVVSGFAEKTKARVKYFSLEHQVDGAYLDGTDLVFGDEKIMDVKDLFVSGKHNVQNALACICVCRLLGVEAKTIAKVLREFKGVKHRVEEVGVVNGVKYIDDSKGTNIDATVKAVESMKGETLLMIGGKDKGYDYTPLFEKLKTSSVVHAIIYGENRFKVLSCAVRAGYERLSLCEKFSFAFRIANMLAKEGQTVLLSPASASFDEFSDFEARGDAFKKMVKELEKGEDTNSEIVFRQAE